MAVKQPYFKPVTIPLNPAASAQLASGRGTVRRISLRETTGAAQATVRFFDGTGTGGTLLDTIALSSGQSTRDRYKCGEYLFEGSLYLQLVSGAVEGAVVVQYLGPGFPELDPVLALTLSDLATVEGVSLTPGSAATVPAP